MPRHFVVADWVPTHVTGNLIRLEILPPDMRRFAAGEEITVRAIRPTPSMKDKGCDVCPVSHDDRYTYCAANPNRERIVDGRETSLYPVIGAGEHRYARNACENNTWISHDGSSMCSHV
jgi:hypothetical protein